MSITVPSVPAATADDLDLDPTTVRILDAALAQVLDHGLRRTSVEDVARHAGLARITIYRRFPGRDDLLRAMLLREGRRLLAQVDQAVDAVDSLEEQVVEGFTAILQATRSHPLLQRLLVTEGDLTITTLTTHGGALVALGREYLAGHLLRAQHEGRLAAFDVRAVAELLVRLTLSFVLTPDSYLSLATPDDARAFARRFVLPMIPAREETP